MVQPGAGGMAKGPGPKTETLTTESRRGFDTEGHGDQAKSHRERWHSPSVALLFSLWFSVSILNSVSFSVKPRG